MVQQSLTSCSLILVGGGGHCKSVVDAAESAGFNIMGILDLPENVGQSICGVNIAKTHEEIAKCTDKALFVISINNYRK